MLVYSGIGPYDKRDLQKHPVIYFHFTNEEGEATESSSSQVAFFSAYHIVKKQSPCLQNAMKLVGFTS